MSTRKAESGQMKLFFSCLASTTTQLYNSKRVCNFKGVVTSWK